MRLIQPESKAIQEILKEHDVQGGNRLNDCLSKLFVTLNDETNKDEVLIKVAALNQIYSTAIQYIAPVVEALTMEIDNSHKTYSLEDYVRKVDAVSRVTWTSKTSSKKHSRLNLSFASKYIHFLSGRLIPIYDSYTWIVMIGYLNQHSLSKRSYLAPKNYAEFYLLFIQFKRAFDLDSYSNYEIDKFLWQYGKRLVNEIMNVKGVGLQNAKSELRKRLSSGI